MGLAEKRLADFTIAKIKELAKAVLHRTLLDYQQHREPRWQHQQDPAEQCRFEEGEHLFHGCFFKPNQQGPKRQNAPPQCLVSIALVRLSRSAGPSLLNFSTKRVMA
jgi:hypothetical protein